MKTVILCGGQGTRLKEETEFKPKPLVEVGGMPILWHIMKTYSHYGFNDFVLCLGYKGNMIKDYFRNLSLHMNDAQLSMKDGILGVLGDNEDWRITFADTGLNTEPGGRIKLIEKYINEDTFLVTYGDGVANINLEELVKFHNKAGKIGTLTGVHPRSKYGTMEVQGDLILDFHEKPVIKDWVSGGFFVFDRKVFDYFKPKGEYSIEEKVFKQLADERQLALYKHEGSWYCMDTYKDTQTLSQLWQEGKAEWKIWDD